MTALGKLGGLVAGLAALPSWLVGFAAGISGAAGAYWYFDPRFDWWHLVVVLAVVAVLLLLAHVGTWRLPELPLEAVGLIGYRTLATLVMAALGAAALIVIAVEVAAPEEAPAGLSEIIGAISTALAAAVTASLTDASEAIDGPAEKAAESAFKKAYDGTFRSNSPGHKAVFSNAWRGLDGWGYGVREERARAVALALAEQQGGARAAASPQPAG